MIRKHRKQYLISIFAIIFFVAIIIMNYMALYSEKRTRLIMDGEVTARKTADRIDKYISSNMDYVSLAAYALDEMLTKDRSDDDIQDFLVRQSDTIRIAVDEDTTGLYACIRGKFFSGTNWVAPEGFDVMSRPWYHKPLTDPSKVTLLEPYHDMQTGHYMMAVGKALVDGASVVSMDMDRSGIQEIVDDTVKNDGTAMGIVINEDNLVIAHSDRAEVGRDYDVQSGSLGQVIVRNLKKNDDDYYFEFKHDEAKYIVYVVKIESGLHCISVMNTTNAFESMRWMMIVSIVAVIAGIWLIGLSVRRYMSKRHVRIENYNLENLDVQGALQGKADDQTIPHTNSVADKKIVSSKEKIKFAGSSSIRTRILRFVLVTILAAESALCIAAIAQSRAAIRNSVCQRMIDIAKCVAGSVNGDIHKDLTIEDYGNEKYNQVYDALAIFRDNVDLEYVYGIKIEEDGRFTFTIDPSVDDPAEFGGELETTVGLQKASLGTPSVDDKPATDEWGTFYSAYSPILDSHGQIAGLVGVDFSVDWFEGQLNRQTREMVIIYLIILMVTMVVTWGLGFLWIRSITEPLAYMTEVAKKYGRGDFSETIETAGSDEIGVLSHTLQTMAGSLQDQVKKAEAANEAKSSFLANMSHEIRTPINTVLGMNEMILRESEDNSILYYAQSIKSAGKSLLNLINDILDFSKIEAGKTEIVPVNYDLAILLNDLLILMQSRAYDKGLTFTTEVDPEIPGKLLGDEGRIRQVITNLLSNAVKYTREGGIIFKVGYEEDKEDKANIYLLVSVSDTGIGIKSEDMEKLFSKFERLDEKTNRNIEGTGLGLSITKSLLELMGSELKVESTYSKGSVFSFRLRQKVVSAAPVGDIKLFAEQQAKKGEDDKGDFVAPTAKILAVDDNPMNLVVLSNLLKRTRVQVDTAVSGDDCIRLSMVKKYDLIFLDHMMPEKDGIETLKELRNMNENPNKETTVICLTANAISGAKEQYLAEGFNDYLSKPVDPVLLEKTLYTFLPEEKLEHGVKETDKATKDNASEKEILQKLSELDFIDVKAGIKNNGNTRAFLEILSMYVDSIDDKSAQLNRMYNENDLTNYTINVHALKSSSRIVGLMELGEDAQKLETASRNRETQFIRINHERFIEKYLGVREPLKSILKASGMEEGIDEEKAMADALKLNRVYNDIKAAAEEMDIDKLEEIISDIKNYSIPAEDEESIDAIRKAIDDFDYDAVVKVVEAHGV